MSQEDEPGHVTTPSHDLLTLLLLKHRQPTGPVNEVWHNLYIGNFATALNIPLLVSLGVTHLVNAADGSQHVVTGAGYYSNTDIHYYGVAATDSRDFELAPFFRPTADFISGALSQKGIVLVHCARGMSRSATLVLAFLMISERLTLEEAITAVCKHRNIFPNAGFLDQLCQLDVALALERRGN